MVTKQVLKDTLYTIFTGARAAASLSTLTPEQQGMFLDIAEVAKKVLEPKEYPDLTLKDREVQTPAIDPESFFGKAVDTSGDASAFPFGRKVTLSDWRE